MNDWREIPFGEAIKLGKRGQYGKARPKDRGSNATSIGRGKAYILARLDRDGGAELAAKVRAGELSAIAAAIAAGFRKQLSVERTSPLGELTDDELAMMEEMLTAARAKLVPALEANGAAIEPKQQKP